MNIGFDIYGKHEIPTYTLCNPDYTQLYNMTVHNTVNNVRFNDVSETSFDVYASYVNDVGITIAYPYYDYVEVRRLVLVDGIGYYIIQDVEETDDGITRYKTVSAKSLQYEAAYKNVTFFKGTYKLYDSVSNYDDKGNYTTFMGYILSIMKGWDVSYIDDELLAKYRTFDESDCSLLELMYDRGEDAYQCIFVFDYLNKLISLRSVQYLTDNPYTTDIFLSFDNLVKNINITQYSASVKTKIYVNNDDLDIRQVNPTGTDYIINLDYYLNTKWMSSQLINKVNSWKAVCLAQQNEYSSQILSLYNKRIEMQTLESQLSALEGELTSLNNVLSVQLQQGISTSTTAININTKTTEINNKKADIAVKQEEINTIITSLSEINKLCNFENNFNKEELNILDKYLVEGTYSNNDYVVTDITTPPERQKLAQELYEEAVNVTQRISQPSFSFDITSNNFMFIPEFEVYTSQLEVGRVINVEGYNSEMYYPLLMEIDFSWEDYDNFKLIFGNRFAMNTSEYIYKDLISEAIVTSNKVKNNWSSLTTFSKEYKKEVTGFLANPINITDKEIQSSQGQVQVWDSSGFTFRKASSNASDASVISYNSEQAKIVDNEIITTTNKWSTSQKVLGMINPKGISSNTAVYGLSANSLVGKFSTDKVAIDGTIDITNVPNLSADKTNSGTFDTDRIPSLDASKITSGTFNVNRIPNLSADKITSGTFGTDRIPSLDASKITSGIFGTGRIPDLSADKITSGTFNTARIPSLSANKITSDTLNINRIPEIPVSKIPFSTSAVTIKEVTVSNKVSIGNSSISFVGFFGTTPKSKTSVFTLSETPTVDNLKSRLNELINALKGYGII